MNEEQSPISKVALRIGELEVEGGRKASVRRPVFAVLHSEYDDDRSFVERPEKMRPKRTASLLHLAAAAVADAMQMITAELLHQHS